MAYYTDDYETAMLLQDQDVLNEPLFDTYMFGSSTDQYSQSTAYSSPCLTDITQFDSFDWQLWAELDQFNNSVAPQDDHLRLSPSPEQATPTDPYLLIEELRLKIVELESRVAKVDELERRLRQVEQSTEDVRLELVTQTFCLPVTDTSKQTRCGESHAWS
jgi:hypothetical protein